MIKNGQMNSCKIVPCAGDQTTHSVQPETHKELTLMVSGSASFNFTFVTRDFFMLSFAATLCFFFITKVTFLFFSDDLFREYCSLYQIHFVW